MLSKGKNILYFICTLISLMTFNKIDKLVLFMAISYIIYKLLNKKAESIC